MHIKLGDELTHSCSKITQIARFKWLTWGPSGADRTQVGPMLAPWTLLSWHQLFSQTVVKFMACIRTYITQETMEYNRSPVLKHVNKSVPMQRLSKALLNEICPKDYKIMLYTISKKMTIYKLNFKFYWPASRNYYWLRTQYKLLNIYLNPPSLSFSRSLSLYVYIYI